MAVALLVGKRALRRVDGQLVEVGRAQARQLRVEVRKQSALQQRIVREIDARHQMRRAERDLLGVGKEVVGPAVEHHAADDFQGHQLFGDQLGRVEVIKGKLCGVAFRKKLHAEFPLREAAYLDGLEEIAAVKVGVGAGDLAGLVPERGLQAELGPPVELDEGGIACGVDQAKAVDAKAFHHAQRARQRAV